MARKLIRCLPSIWTALVTSDMLAVRSAMQCGRRRGRRTLEISHRRGSMPSRLALHLDTLAASRLANAGSAVLQLLHALHPTCPVPVPGVAQ